MRHHSPSAWVKTLASFVSSTRALAPALLGALLLAPGCSDTPTSPLESPGSNLSTTSLDFVNGKTVGPEWTVSQEMRVRGGSIALDGEQLVCTFPAGALPVNQTTITAVMKLNAPRGEATRIDIDFQPSMTFKKSISLKVDASYLVGTANKYTLWYFDPVARTWVKQMEQTFDAAAPSTFTLDHYSAYALTR